VIDVFVDKVRKRLEVVPLKDFRHSLSLLNDCETAEREVQDTCCRGSGGAPRIKKIPQDWGIRGLIVAISEVSIMFSKDAEVLI